ncbi:serine protease, partial [Danaus plexippus plexippus]
MVKIISVLLIISFADVRAQLFDFLTAFQPQTLRPIFEPTKPTRTTRFFDTNRTQNASWKLGQSTELTTAKAIRKTPKSNRRSQNKTKKIKENYGPDKIAFDDGYNSIISYDTVKHTTVNPFARPGVKPAVVNGPPITNRPVTRSFAPRPIAGLQPHDDNTVTPELIVGPDEDYMSTVERRRFMEVTEK